LTIFYKETIAKQNLQPPFGLGAVHKRRPQSGGKKLSSADKGGGVFRYGCPHFFRKNFGFLKFMVCPHGLGGRGLNQCGHFADKGGGVNFYDFMWMTFTDGPLLNDAIK